MNADERPRRPARQPRPRYPARRPAEPDATEPFDGAITALRAVRGDAVAIDVDGLPWLTVSREAVLTQGLHVGLAVDAGTAATLRSFDERRQAYEAALLLLAYRPRSESELRTRLARRGLGAEAVAAALARVREAGLLDDAAFARAWVEDRSSARGRGRRTLAAELRAKGVDPDAAEPALAGVDDAERALEVARQRSARLGELPWREFQLKLGGFLSRRGFGYETIGPVLRTLWRERHDAS